jgi:peptidoglycan-associated lipoprotein
VRLALGILLVLGLADLALLNLHLAPQLAMQQAPVPTETARTPHVPSAPVSTGSALRVAPLPPVSAVAVVSAAPTGAVASVAVQEPPVAPPPVTVAPPVAVAPPPVPVPVPVPSTPSSPGESIADVNFELSSFQITYLPSIVALKRVAEELRNDPSRKLLIRGHTDQMGPDSYKHALSQRRATTVQMFLISHGAPLDRITVEAVGDSEPIDPGNNPVAWAKNRRVQVLWR